MKSIAEVKHHLETSIHSMLERPDMYASTPECLEEMLSHLDQLRLDICPPDTSPHDFGYPAFLSARGYGSANFFTRQRLDGKAPGTTAKRFKRIVEFWREYLQSEHFAKL